jgi:metallopeptidase MepB
MSPYRIPPQAPVQFNYTPSSLVAAAEKVRDAAVAVMDDIVASIQPQDATFQNAILPLAESENERLHMQRTLTMQGSFHPQKEIKDATRAAGTFFSNMELVLLARDEIVDIFNHVRSHEWENLDHESQ